MSSSRTMEQDRFPDHTIAVVGVDYGFAHETTSTSADINNTGDFLLQTASRALQLPSLGDELSNSTQGKSIGCYIGVPTFSDDEDSESTSIPSQNFRAKAISRAFRWIGPSLNFDAGKASCATAIQAACRAINSGQCSQALAGGFSPITTTLFQQKNTQVSFSSLFNNRDGISSTTSRRGMGLLVLKDYSNAIADGDFVFSAITSFPVHDNSEAPFDDDIETDAQDDTNWKGAPLNTEKLNTPPTSDFDLSLYAQESFEKVRLDYDIYAEKTGFANFWEKTYPMQSQLVSAYVVEAFAALGCSLRHLKPGERLPNIEHLPKHNKVVGQYRDILLSTSLVESSRNQLLRTSVPIETKSAKEIYHEILTKYPQHASEHKLLDITGSKLAECLSGTIDPLQLLFGNKESIDLLTDVYTNAPMFAAVTQLLGKFLQLALSKQSNSGPYNILEIGAGTGGTTTYIIDALVQAGIPFTFTFTDISAALVAAAKKRFAGRDYMRYVMLDIEKTPPAELEGKYHTVISSNCIHATRNLIETSSNIRKLLRPDGFLALVELTRNLPWLDCVFGLLEGWWLFEDGRQHALATEQLWDSTLRATNFKHVLWSDSPSKESQGLRVIAAFPTTS